MSLVELGIRSTLLLLAGWMVAGIIRKAPASSRNLVWRLTVLGLILLPAMQLRLPAWEVSVERIPMVHKAVQLVQPEPARVSPSVGIVEPAHSASGSVGSEPATFNWLTAAADAWGILSVIACLPLLFSMFALYRTIRRSRPIESPELSDLCIKLSIRRRTVLRISPDIQTPATAGFFKPLVILPESAMEWDQMRMEMVFRHELGHVQRGDWLMRVLAHLSCILYAPNPLVWYACTRLREESEAACDDLVVAGGVNAKAYAEELLSIARFARQSSLGLATVGMAHRSKVESRLRAIVDPTRRRHPVSRRTSTLLMTLGGCLVCIIANIRLVIAQDLPNQGPKSINYGTLSTNFSPPIQQKSEPIAPGFQKTVRGLGSVGISAVVTDRIVNHSWTEDGQPKWRPDGMRIEERDQPSGVSATQVESTPNPPTDILFQFSGSGWEKVNTRLRIEGEQVDELPLQSSLPSRLVRVFGKNDKETVVLLEIADGPWQVIDSRPVDIKMLPDVDPKYPDRLSTGIALLDGDRAQIVTQGDPSSRNPKSDVLKAAPKNSAHRFVLVLQNGNTVELGFGYSIMIPARRGEAHFGYADRQDGHSNFLASDIKEVRYEIRPISRTIRFEHVALKPKT